MGEYEDSFCGLVGEADLFPPPAPQPVSRERIHIQKSSVCSRAYFVVVMVFFHLYIVNIIALLLYVHYNTGSETSDQEMDKSFIAPRSILAEQQTQPPNLRPEQTLHLPRLEGIRVGHVQRVSLFPDRTHHMRTLSLKPLLFEVPGFLTAEESSVVMQLAQLKGLTDDSSFISPESQEEQLTQDELFSLLDLNQDGLLQREEILSLSHSSDAFWLSSHNLRQIHTNLETSPTGVLSLQEFKHVSAGVSSIGRSGLGVNTKLRQRSTRTQLYLGEGAHHLLKSIRHRVTRLTRLPSTLVDLSEPMEVVRYEQGGYSHAHHDSSSSQNSSCLHTHLATSSSALDQVTCRYLTILLFLKSAEGGGETSFPTADNRTYEETALGDLSQQYCDKGNLKVKPVAGTALLWYNHLSDGNGWVGELDEFSLHGDCLVSGGVKWTGSVWVNIDPDQQRQERYQRLVSWSPQLEDQRVEHTDLHQDL